MHLRERLAGGAASRLAALFGLAFLWGCASAPAPPESIATQPSGAVCLAALESRGAAFTRVAAFGEPGGCGIATAIELHAAQAGLSRSVQLDCATALALHDFETEVVFPAALDHFGQPVVRLHHMGAYACRGRSSNRGRLSEHALGRAIDISGFELADGRVIRVTQWRQGGPEGRFLRQVARGACQIFSVVLTPLSDADHHDHFHLDVGPHALCDA